MRRLLAVAAGVLLVPALAAPASAASERMELHCNDGRVLERTNGSSWWDTATGAVLLTERIVVVRDGQVVYEHDQGRKSPQAVRSTCVAEHFGSTWTVKLAQPR